MKRHHIDTKWISRECQHCWNCVRITLVILCWHFLEATDVPGCSIGEAVIIHVATLQCRQTEHEGVPTRQRLECLLDRLFRRRSNKSSKLRVTGLCEGIHQWPVDSPKKGPLRGNCFYLMTSSCILGNKVAHFDVKFEGRQVSTQTF